MGLLSSLFGGKSSEEKQAATQEEKNFDTLKYDGIRARNIHQLPYAIKCFENAIRLKEEPETMMLLANAYLQTDATDDARTTLDRLVEIQPDHLENLLALARVCYLQADYKSMDIACQKAIKLDETNATSYYMAAQAYRGLQNPIQAIVMRHCHADQSDSPERKLPGSIPASGRSTLGYATSQRLAGRHRACSVHPSGK